MLQETDWISSPTWHEPKWNWMELSSRALHAKVVGLHPDISSYGWGSLMSAISQNLCQSEWETTRMHSDVCNIVLVFLIIISGLLSHFLIFFHTGVPDVLWDCSFLMDISACCTKLHSNQWMWFDTTTNVIEQCGYCPNLSTHAHFCSPMPTTGKNCMLAYCLTFHHFIPTVFKVAYFFFSWNQVTWK